MKIIAKSAPLIVSSCVFCAFHHLSSIITFVRVFLLSLIDITSDTNTKMKSMTRAEYDEIVKIKKLKPGQKRFNHRRIGEISLTSDGKQLRGKKGKEFLIVRDSFDEADNFLLSHMILYKTLTYKPKSSSWIDTQGRKIVLAKYEFVPKEYIEHLEQNLHSMEQEALTDPKVKKYIATLATTVDEIHAMVKDHDEDILTLTESVNSQGKKYNWLRQLVLDLKGEVSDIKGEVSDIKADGAKLTRRVDNLEASVDKHNESIKRLKVSVGKHDEDVHQMATKMDILQNRQDDQIKEIRAEFAELKTQMSSLLKEESNNDAKVAKVSTNPLSDKTNSG